jgi:hypothetical protein
MSIHPPGTRQYPSHVPLQLQNIQTLSSTKEKVAQWVKCQICGQDKGPEEISTLFHRANDRCQKNLKTHVCHICLPTIDRNCKRCENSWIKIEQHTAAEIIDPIDERPLQIVIEKIEDNPRTEEAGIAQNPPVQMSSTPPGACSACINTAITVACIGIMIGEIVTLFTCVAKYL